jgi:hypothetical protein
LATQIQAIAAKLPAIAAITVRAAMLDSSLRNDIMIANPITASTLATRYHVVVCMFVSMRRRQVEHMAWGMSTHPTVAALKAQSVGSARE